MITVHDCSKVLKLKLVIVTLLTTLAQTANFHVIRTHY